MEEVKKNLSVLTLGKSESQEKLQGGEISAQKHTNAPLTATDFFKAKNLNLKQQNQSQFVGQEQSQQSSDGVSFSIADSASPMKISKQMTNSNEIQNHQAKTKIHLVHDQVNDLELNSMNSSVFSQPKMKIQ